MNERLAESIRTLYSAFSPYVKHMHDPHESCDCCMTPAERERNVPTQLHQFGHADLHYYAQLPMSLWGNKDDLRYFLPRILELCLMPKDKDFQSVWDIDLIIAKLPEGDWRQWPQAEQDAIEHFLLEWWDELLLDYPGPERAYDLLGGLAQIYPDLSKFLALWSASVQSAALRHFAESWPMLDSHRFDDHQRKQLTDWIGDKRTILWLESGYHQFASEPWAPDFASQLEGLVMLQNSR